MGNLCNHSQSNQTFDFKYDNHRRKLSEIQELQKNCLKNLFEANKVELMHRQRYGATESEKGYQAMREKAKDIELEYERLIERQREILRQAQNTFSEEVRKIQERQNIEKWIITEAGRGHKVNQMNENYNKYNNPKEKPNDQEQQINPKLIQKQKQQLKDLNTNNGEIRSIKSDHAFSIKIEIDSKTNPTTIDKGQNIHQFSNNSQNRNSQPQDSILLTVERFEHSELQLNVKGVAEEQQKMQPSISNNSTSGVDQQSKQPMAACLLYECRYGQHYCPLRFQPQ
ncbi:hypothetical protein FGO68_gene11388 [Halteria grandinella]|uniref:Uncharacterized protein n=1 Tax=Halteria grandinella TaxID=5974 RepID=A0A8J8P5Q7_HALGN|nr:hypothetical protein FGO68_gene11388 [Halteria grandinella]